MNRSWKDILKTFVENLVMIAIAFAILSALAYGLVHAFSDKFKIYKCVDTFGNTVYCERVDIYEDSHIMYGVTHDGTVVQIVQYKVESRIKGEQ